MNRQLPISFDTVARLLHRRFLLLLVGCYVIASLLPAPGAWLSRVAVETGLIRISFQTVMLMVAMFFGALAIQPQDRSAATSERRPVHSWLRAFAGFGGLRAFLLIGALGLVVVSDGHLVTYGLLIVFAMPAAMSAVPWTQKTNGNIALCMGMIVSSLIVAPLGLMIALLAASQLTDEIASGAVTHPSLTTLLSTPVFQLLLFSIPALIGLITGRFIRGDFREAWSPFLKFIPAVVILVLNYCNAARVFPTLHANSAADLLPVAIVSTIAAVTIAMLASHLLSARLRLDRPDRIAVTYTSGMYNTGMAMVLVAGWLPDVPALLIPILLFTLGQHVVAAAIEKRREKSATDQDRCPRTITTKPVSINEP